MTPTPLTAPPTRIAVISCGKLKLDRPAPAGELYTGPGFTDARRHALDAGYDHWLILSALHGIVHPTQILEPYEQTIDDLRAEELRTWARRVERTLRLGTAYLDGGELIWTDYPGWAHLPASAVFDFYAPAGYVDPLKEHLDGRVAYAEPLRGLQQGERRGWFKARRTAEAA